MRPVLVLALALLPRVLLGAEDSTRTIKQSTEVLGDVPADLAGRWLVVSTVNLPSGKKRPVAVTWEIRPGDGHLELTLQRSPLPPVIHDAVEAAARAGTSWEPSAVDRRAVVDVWGAPPTTEDDHTAIETKIAAAGAYPAEIADDEMVKASPLAIVLVEDFTGKQHVARTTSIYGIRERTPESFSGPFVTTTLAIAYFAIPITMKGEFRAYRLEPSRSWLERLLSGCRR